MGMIFWGYVCTTVRYYQECLKGNHLHYIPFSGPTPTLRRFVIRDQTRSLLCRYESGTCLIQSVRDIQWCRKHFFKRGIQNGNESWSMCIPPRVQLTFANLFWSRPSTFGLVVACSSSSMTLLKVIARHTTVYGCDSIHTSRAFILNMASLWCCQQWAEIWIYKTKLGMSTW